MKTVIGIRREDQNKKGESRAAITPPLAEEILRWGHRLIVQPAVASGTTQTKRCFPDEMYTEHGAELSEDLGAAELIFGLKEINIDAILPNKTYLLFSHTHKGQKKNRAMLKAFAERGCSVIDYELVTNEEGGRLLTAFTYFAGYAGMVDTLWALGLRLRNLGIENPFAKIPQSLHGGGLDALKHLLHHEISEAIRNHGTPASLPPVITCILGRGKTSHGAQSIYDLLPVQEITLDELPHIYAKGSRKQLYKLVLEVHQMYRLREGFDLKAATWASWSEEEKFRHYLVQPEMYETNLGAVLPYITLLMNCIIWSSRYPRVFTNEMAKALFQQPRQPLIVGDISCDPNGGIEFSQETWIDEPLFVYNPFTQQTTLGAKGDGIVVMAVTNLPCEFPVDASLQFATDLRPLIPALLKSDLESSFHEAGLPEAIQRATLLWKGQFTPEYNYMKEFIL